MLVPFLPMGANLMIKADSAKLVAGRYLWESIVRVCTQVLRYAVWYVLVLYCKDSTGFVCI